MTSASGPLEEFLAAYLVETEEHLAVANAQLLAIEGSLRRGEGNPRAVRETFRTLHTIKGLSAMVGVDPIVAIAHRMEAFLRSYDRSGADLPARAIDVLLRGLRAIEQRVGALGKGAVTVAAPPDELLAELDALESGVAPKEAESTALALEASLLQKLAPFEVELLRNAGQHKKRALRADFVPSPAKAERGLTINSVRERLGKLAEIVKVLPRSLPVSQAAPGGLSFVVLFTSDQPNDILASALDIQPGEIESLLAHDDGPPSSAAPPPLTSLEGPDDAPAAPRRGIVRVDVNRLDDAMERLSTLIVTRFRLARAVNDLAVRGVNTREISEILAENTRQLRDLRAAIVSVRMVPVAELLERVPLLVRGLQRQTQRLVKLELETSNAELDKAVSERLFPAIVHLVRNAVDHAIETPDERVRRGKPEHGRLRISCGSRTNNRLELVIEDDGRGIEREAVARKAGQPVPSTDAGLLELLCIPGLSTRNVVTVTSGRGMGMEIVKRIVVGDLGGELELTTQPGVGTKFTLRVPLTISIVDAFSFECASQRFVVPVATVEEIVEIEPKQVLYATNTPGKDVGLIARRGKAIPLVMLRDVFKMTSTGPSARAIVVRRAGRPVAFGVDRVLGQQEVVVRPMADELVRTPGVSGATDLGDGRPTLVLDLVALCAALGPLPEREAVSR